MSNLCNSQNFPPKNIKEYVTTTVLQYLKERDGKLIRLESLKELYELKCRHMIAYPAVVCQHKNCNAISLHGYLYPGDWSDVKNCDWFEYCNGCWNIPLICSTHCQEIKQLINNTICKLLQNSSQQVENSPSDGGQIYSLPLPLFLSTKLAQNNVLHLNFLCEDCYQRDFKLSEYPRERR